MHQCRYPGYDNVLDFHRRLPLRERKRLYYFLQLQANLQLPQLKFQIKTRSVTTICSLAIPKLYCNNFAFFETGALSVYSIPTQLLMITSFHHVYCENHSLKWSLWAQEAFNKTIHIVRLHLHEAVGKATLL